MLALITRRARWLDLWLRKHLGSPYLTLLASGLGISIVASLTALAQALTAAKAGFEADSLRIAVIVVFQAGLLINQLAQLDEIRQRRRRRRQRKRARATQTPVPRPPSGQAVHPPQ
jgi:hypothetical protein